MDTTSDSDKYCEQPTVEHGDYCPKHQFVEHISYRKQCAKCGNQCSMDALACCTVCYENIVATLLQERCIDRALAVVMLKHLTDNYPDLLDDISYAKLIAS